MKVMTEMHALSGKVVLLTGAAGRIGQATAALMAERGAMVIAVDRRGADWSGFRDSQPDGTSAAILEGDVTSERDVSEYVAKASTVAGRIDIFFNNAGIEGPQEAIPDYPLTEFRRILDINVVGIFLGLKYVLPVMLQQGWGSVINVSSIAGLVGSANMAGYVASKHAVLGLTRAAALEVAECGVRVNSIHPGNIDSRMISDIPMGPDGNEDQLASQVPARRLDTPEDIARVVAFLASDESSYLNGTALTVDGNLAAA
jgi:NAD(P)-dependent dehydrogenase (short-subunit alcohol dehydrogenase family)